MSRDVLHTRASELQAHQVLRVEKVDALLVAQAIEFDTAGDIARKVIAAMTIDQRKVMQRVAEVG